MTPSPLPAVPHRPRTATRSGLALVELAVILVVLAVIAVVAVPRLGRAQADPLNATVRGDLAVLRNAIELYAADHDGAYPPIQDFETVLTQPLNGQGPYLQAVPGLGDRSPRAQDAPRVAPFASPHTPSDASPTVAWFYDERTGRIQPNIAAGR